MAPWRNPRLWSPLSPSSLLLIVVWWTLPAPPRVHCKPLQQQSNDRFNGDRSQQVTTVYDLDSLNDALDSRANQQQQGDDDVRLEKLSRTMNALAQFRRVINNRLLTRNSLTYGDDEDDSDNNENSNPRSSILVDPDENERTLMMVVAPRTPAPSSHRSSSASSSSHRSHHHHRRKPHDRTNTDNSPPPVVTSGGRQFAREHREDPESQANGYRIHGFNIKAHLQPETSAVVPAPAPRDTGQQSQQQQVLQQGGEEQSQRFMTGRTSTLDERLPDLPQSEFECPRLNGKTTQVLCPSRRRHGYRVCIPDTALCNEKLDCPNGEDEDPVNCLFYKTTIHHFRLVVDAVVELSDMIKQQRRRGLDEL